MVARFRTFTSVMTILTVLFALGSGYAAESVRLLDKIEEGRSVLTLMSSTQSKVELEVGVDALMFSPTDDWGENYLRAELPEGEFLTPGFVSEIGEPDVPILTTMVAIPDNAGITASATYGSYEIIENIDLLPAQEPTPEGGLVGPRTFSINQACYQEDAFYPGNLVDLGEPMILKDLRVAQVMINPVQYNPVTRQLKVYHDISVSVEYEGEVINPKTNRHQYVSEAFLPIYRSFVANADDFLMLNTADVRRGGILFIVPEIGSYQWKTEIQELTTWKRQKGYEVVVATTHDIDPSDGKPSNTQIKAYIQNLYNTLDVPLDFVCIVGDEDLSYSGYLVPDYPYSSYPSDHQYACVEGTDWLPDLAITRAAVDNTNELQTWMAKTLKYERDPEVLNDPDYWNRAIMVAGAQQTVTCVWVVLWTKERLHEQGFTTIDTVFDRGSDPPDHLITNPITAGVGYVNYRGWAGASGWYDPSYNTSALNQCQNVNKPGVMTSIVCGTGNFGSTYADPCFGETWIRMGSPTAPRGGPSFFGTTDGSTHTQWNNPITFGFYHALINQENYHFAAAAVAGKLRQLASYPRASSTIQKYFHTYNMLGDPELSMRLGIPKHMNVNAPSSVPQGTNFIEVSVIGDNFLGIEGAYCTLILGEGDEEHFFSVAKTDADGYAMLEVPNDTTAELTFTVSARDYYPHISPIAIESGDVIVTYHATEIDDDASGYSNGNNDGLANPCETLELTIDIENWGASIAAENVYATLTSADENLAVVHHNMVTYGNIGPGETSSGDASFVVTLKPDVIYDEVLVFDLHAYADGYPAGWTSHVLVPISAAKFDVSDVDVSDNGRLDPGETADLVIELTNAGDLEAAGLTGKLESLSGFVQVLDGDVSFGAIDPGNNGDNGAYPISVNVDAGTFEGHNVPFLLTLTDDHGAIYKTTFNLTVGLISAVDPSGPDAYGYYMYDNLDTGAPETPAHTWEPIYGNGGANLFLTDDSNVIMDLPFTFIYYGEQYDRITICSNGFVSMDSSQWSPFRNWPLPDQSYNHAMVAAFWDDLGPSGSNNVYVKHDQVNNRYIVEWHYVPARWNTSAHQTFQIILYDPLHHPTITGDGIIEYVYNDINNGESSSEENYCSVGWEDWSELRGFGISYSNQNGPGCPTLADNKTFRITTNNGRGAVGGMITVTGGGVAGTMVKASTGQWQTLTTASYFLKDVPPGTVDITASKDGWFPATLNDLSIVADERLTGQNIALEQCPIPSSLEASENLVDHINITWVGVSHSDLLGYDIYRSRFENGIYTKINDTPLANTSYDDYTTEDYTDYWYYVVAVYEGADYDAMSVASNIVVGSNNEITDIDDTTPIPTVFNLSQNYPNPFNARTVIGYSLPEAGDVKLEIFNLLGQKVSTLVNDYQDAGYKSVIWTGTDESGDPIASGVYFYRISINDKTSTKQMLMLK